MTSPEGRWGPVEKAHIERRMRVSAVGSPATVRDSLEALPARADADELILALPAALQGAFGASLVGVYPREEAEAKVDAAHARGLKIYGGTLTPFEGLSIYSSEKEAKRQAVNA